MIGNPDSGGVYAPCLSYHDERFYLIFSDVKNVAGRFWDANNYLVTTDDIEGEWSEPTYLHSRGIDPSLFHHSNGTKWLVSMEMSHMEGGKPGFPKWNGIIIQQYDAQENRLVGECRKIYAGSALGTTEGPHIYQRDGWFYLLTAEGGTFYNHGVTLARSRNLFGPYETDPIGQMMTSRYDCRLPLQRVGHADLFENTLGESFIVHLCGRPLATKGRSPMGRETAIQRVYWNEEGWLRLINEKTTPESVVHTRLEEHPWPALPAKMILTPRICRCTISRCAFRSAKRCARFVKERAGCACMAVSLSVLVIIRVCWPGGRQILLIPPRPVWIFPRARFSKWPDWSAFTIQRIICT